VAGQGCCLLFGLPIPAATACQGAVGCAAAALGTQGAVTVHKPPTWMRACEHAGISAISPAKAGAAGPCLTPCLHRLIPVDPLLCSTLARGGQGLRGATLVPLVPWAINMSAFCQRCGPKSAGLGCAAGIVNAGTPCQCRHTLPMAAACKLAC
jgi:hypothetical protein